MIQNENGNNMMKKNKKSPLFLFLLGFAALFVSLLMPVFVLSFGEEYPGLSFDKAYRQKIAGEIFRYEKYTVRKFYSYCAQNLAEYEAFYQIKERAKISDSFSKTVKKFFEDEVKKIQENDLENAEVIKLYVYRNSRRMPWFWKNDGNWDFIFDNPIDLVGFGIFDAKTKEALEVQVMKRSKLFGSRYGDVEREYSWTKDTGWRMSQGEALLTSFALQNSNVFQGI